MVYSRKRIVEIKDFWFETKRNTTEEHGADYVQYHDLQEEIDDKSNLVREFISETLLTDLTLTEDELLSSFRKNTRYEIRRAQKEAFTVTVYNCTALKNRSDIIDTVDAAHQHMFQQKGLTTKKEAKNLLAAANAGMLMISTAQLPNGTVCVYHVYVVGPDSARLWHSISVFRNNHSNEERNAVGRANRMLHFEDMRTLRNAGCRIYDWGGYSEAKDLKQIAEFKASFGGKRVQTYRYIFAVSLKGRLLSSVIKRKLHS